MIPCIIEHRICWILLLLFVLSSNVHNTMFIAIASRLIHNIYIYIYIYTNQKFPCEHSGIKVGRPAMPRQIFLGQPYSTYRGPLDVICHVYWVKLPTIRPTIYSCLWWGNHTSIVRIMWTLPMHFPNHFPQYIQEIQIFCRKSLIIYKLGK